MQFPVMVLVPGNTEDIIAAVRHLMAQFDARRKVPAHKEYVPQDDIAYTLEVFAPYGLQAEDRDGILRALEEDSGCSGGIDESGIFLMTTDNPEGYWDSWRIQSLHNDVQPVSRIRRDYAPAAIVTPDGIWHDLNMDLPINGDPQVIRWKNAEPLLASYPDYLAVTVRCHL